MRAASVYSNGRLIIALGKILLYWFLYASLTSAFVATVGNGAGEFQDGGEITVDFTHIKIAETYTILRVITNTGSSLVLHVKLERRAAMVPETSSAEESRPHEAKPAAEVSGSRESGEIYSRAEDDEFILKIAPSETDLPSIQNESGAHIYLGAMKPGSTRPAYFPRIFDTGITTIFTTTTKSFTSTVIKMEVLEEDDLAKIFEKQTKGVSKTSKEYEIILLRLLAQVWTILVEIHKKGVIHNDVKVDNFMVAKSGQVVIIDFEFALYKGSPLEEDGGTGFTLIFEPVAMYAKSDKKLRGILKKMLDVAWGDGQDLKSKYADLTNTLVDESIRLDPDSSKSIILRNRYTEKDYEGIQDEDKNCGIHTKNLSLQ